MNTHSRRRFIIGLTALVAWPLKMFGKAARPLRGDEIKSSNEMHVSRLAELSVPSRLIACSMIYHCIRYTIDPHKLADFEMYAHKWMDGDIIRRCGGKPIGYFLPKKGLGGSDHVALALIGFESLADYEKYRGKLMDDSDARANLAEAEKSRCILSEERSHFYRIE